MKQLLLYILLGTFYASAQTQIGSDIDGAAANDQFGYAVSLSEDGTRMAIGGRYYDDGSNLNAGHVRIFENNNGSWVQLGSDIVGTFDDNLGHSVSLNANGTRVAVGAPYYSTTSNSVGQVKIYEYDAGVWQQIGTDIIGNALNNWLGWSVSLSANGSTLAIGLPGNSNSFTYSGSVRLYEDINGTWTQIGNDIDGQSLSEFSGTSISLSDDGSTVAIGAASYNSVQGVVRIYQNNAGTWAQVGSIIEGEAVGDQSGYSVSLNTDGSIVAIGAYQNDGNGSDSGHVRIYQNTGGTWTQIGSDIDGELANDGSGFSVSLCADGSIVAIGAYQNGGNNGPESGHVRIYKNNGGNWVQIGSDIDGEASGDGSGWFVSLSGNGSTVAIGAPTNDGNGSNSGHIRVYDLSQVLSTGEVDSIKDFKLYPNPAQHQFTVSVSDNASLEDIKVYNTLGQLLIRSQSHTINTSGLTSGTYLVDVTTDIGRSTKKLIIE